MFFKKHNVVSNAIGRSHALYYSRQKTCQQHRKCIGNGGKPRYLLCNIMVTTGTRSLRLKHTQCRWECPALHVPNRLPNIPKHDPSDRSVLKCAPGTAKCVPRMPKCLLASPVTLLVSPIEFSTSQSVLHWSQVATAFSSCCCHITIVILEKRIYLHGKFHLTHFYC